MRKKMNAVSRLSRIVNVRFNNILYNQMLELTTDMSVTPSALIRTMISREIQNRKVLPC